MPDLEGHDLISLLYRCLCSGLHAIDKIPGYFEVVPIKIFGKNENYLMVW